MTALVADVKVSDDLGRLVVAPRRRDEVRAVSAALQEELPGVRLRRTAAGIDLDILSGARMLDGARGLELRWRADASRYAELRRGAEAAHMGFRETVEGLRRLPRSELEALLSGVGAVDQLDDHQVLNVAVMAHADCRGVCLFDEQGAGKTVSAIYAWDALSAMDAVDFALVVAPKSMVPEWARDFERFRPGMYSVGVAAGGRRNKLAALRRGPDVLITNFETAVSLEQELTAQLRGLDGRGVLIVDESFFVKNRDARRTGALRRLREWCGRALVLCGTPAPNRADDVVEQFNLADLGVTFADVDIPEEHEAAHEVVNRTLRHRGVYLRSLKGDVLPDLPEKSFDVVRLDLAPLQRHAYESALADLIIDLRSTDDAEFARELTSYMARRAALLQICSNPARIIAGYDETPAKLAALDLLLDDLVARAGEKVVIWSAYRASLDAIVERFARLGVVRYDGSVTGVDARRAVVRAFQEDPATQVFVGNPAAAGAGLTLHAARVAIYESVTNQAAHYLQSLDRIHRRGQNRDVRYIVLLGADTIEEPNFDTLRRKERSAQDLLGDAVTQPPTRSAMLDELVSSATRLGLDVPMGS